MHRQGYVGSVDHTDKLFSDCLKEIRIAYLELAKPIRLRVEKWVEKLVLTTDKNLTWKRHRNAYAKLLLGMIVSETLSDPFHQFPPDGPLPTFPSQHNHKFKSMLGAHESSFWRELFQNLESSETNSKTARADSDSSRLLEMLERPTLSPSRPVNREIQNLAALIRQQESRIQLLEQQLKDERIQHELQIQRLHYSHRIELGSIADTTNFQGAVNHSLTHNINANTSYDYDKLITVEMPCGCSLIKRAAAPAVTPLSSVKPEGIFAIEVNIKHNGDTEPLVVTVQNLIFRLQGLRNKDNIYVETAVVCGRDNRIPAGTFLRLVKIVTSSENGNIPYFVVFNVGEEKNTSLRITSFECIDPPIDEDSDPSIE